MTADLSAPTGRSCYREPRPLNAYFPFPKRSRAAPLILDARHLVLISRLYGKKKGIAFMPQLHALQLLRGKILLSGHCVG